MKLACILTVVAQMMNVQLSPKVPLPEIRLETQTPLSRFQDAIEPQWGFRPDVFVNAYALATNEIYLIEDAGYYRRTKRFIEDSLAHELVHYIQVKYQNYSVQDLGENAEAIAVDFQTAFREHYMMTGKDPCIR
jgi:hypothetical protein